MSPFSFSELSGFTGSSHSISVAQQRLGGHNYSSRVWTLTSTDQTQPLYPQWVALCAHSVPWLPTYFGGSRVATASVHQQNLSGIITASVYLICLHMAPNRTAASSVLDHHHSQGRGCTTWPAAFGGQLTTQLDPMRVPNPFSGGVIQSPCFIAESVGTWGHWGF